MIAGKCQNVILQSALKLLSPANEEKNIIETAIVPYPTPLSPRGGIQKLYHQNGLHYHLSNRIVLSTYILFGDKLKSLDQMSRSSAFLNKFLLPLRIK